MRNTLHRRKLDYNTCLLNIIINGWGKKRQVTTKIQTPECQQTTMVGGSAPRRQKNEKHPTPQNPMEIFFRWVEFHLVQA